MNEAPKLVPCRDCGHQVSKEALMRPSCGRRVTFTSAVFFAVLCVGVVLAIIGVVFAILIVLLGSLK